MLKIILADDHHVVRQGLRTLLEAVLSCTVVGEAADGREAVAMVARLKPDVLVVDMLMPDLNGLEVIRRIQEDNHNTRIVVLSMYADEGYVREALRAGAHAYVLKEARADEFILAVREAVAGRRYLSPPLSERAITSYVRQVGGSTQEAHDSLSVRERDVLYLSAQGYTATQIAERLAISSRTVESHRGNMMRKLGLQTQTDLLRYALRHGIISLDE
jgi:DNA-binding NarL/FixJ family response regulator